MAKLRLMFRKEGRAVYISHLDLLRTFQRVFLREGLVLRHSQGFHPHPLLAFALPLSVGQSSDCELLDFEVDGQVDCAALPENLNRFMPEGIMAVDCWEAVRPIRELDALRCRVELIYDGGVTPETVQAVQELFAREEIVIQKRTKRKAMADVDIRPLIRSIDFSAEGDTLCMDVVVAAQNPGLNPALLATAVETCLPERKPDFVRVQRLMLLDSRNEVFR